MQVFDTPLSEVKLVRPDVHGDDRGWFSEIFSTRTFAKHGLPTRFVQDNQSYSRHGVLRGLHFQLGNEQGKLVRAASGHIWDVAVDLRPGSPQFGQWAGFHLTGEVIEYLWIPEGFGHGFLVLSETASVMYKVTNLYDAKAERAVRWNDPALGIEWPIDGFEPQLSARDIAAPLLKDAELPNPYKEPVTRS